MVLGDLSLKLHAWMTSRSTSRVESGACSVSLDRVHGRLNAEKSERASEWSAVWLQQTIASRVTDCVRSFDRNGVALFCDRAWRVGGVCVTWHGGGGFVVGGRAGRRDRSSLMCPLHRPSSSSARTLSGGLGRPSGWAETADRDIKCHQTAATFAGTRSTRPIIRGIVSDYVARAPLCGMSVSTRRWNNEHQSYVTIYTTTCRLTHRRVIERLSRRKTNLTCALLLCSRSPCCEWPNTEQYSKQLTTVNNSEDAQLNA